MQRAVVAQWSEPVSGSAAVAVSGAWAPEARPPAAAGVVEVAVAAEVAVPRSAAASALVVSAAPAARLVPSMVPAQPLELGPSPKSRRYRQIPSRQWFPAVPPAVGTTADRSAAQPGSPDGPTLRSPHQCARQDSSAGIGVPDDPLHAGRVAARVTPQPPFGRAALPGELAGEPAGELAGAGVDGVGCADGGVAVCSANSATLVNPPWVIVPITCMIRP